MNARSNQITLRHLPSFGDVAAEDDAVLEYFLATEAVEKIRENHVFLVLGRKGSGKTAIVRHFSEGVTDTVSRALSLRGYPWNLHAQRIDRGASDIEAYVSTWRYLLVSQLAALALTRADGVSTKNAKSLRKFFQENYGGVDVELSHLLRPKSLRLSKLSFEPTVLGNKLGGIALERTADDFQLGVELNALTDTIFEATRCLISELELPPVLLHLDELDQGLTSLDTPRSRMLTGLILAARSLRRDLKTNNTAANAVVYLRSDLWDELEFSDKNKISQSSALHLAWNSSTLQDLVVARLRARVSPDATWENVAESELMRGSQPKWNHILSRTFLRPRDVIKFLNAALEQARGRPDEPLQLANEDIVAAREPYSRYLKDELDDEILPHWAHWEEALRACSAIATVTFERSQFNREYKRKCTSSNVVSADQALAIMYRFSVLGYERRSGYGGSSWAFQYSDPEAGWDSSATKFKVHLGLKEYARLREERR